jgi:hypothetical protein
MSKRPSPRPSPRRRHKKNPRRNIIRFTSGARLTVDLPVPVVASALADAVAYGTFPDCQAVAAKHGVDPVSIRKWWIYYVYHSETPCYDAPEIHSTSNPALADQMAVRAECNSARMRYLATRYKEKPPQEQRVVPSLEDAWMAACAVLIRKGAVPALDGRTLVLALLRRGEQPLTQCIPPKYRRMLEDAGYDMTPTCRVYDDGGVVSLYGVAA